MINHYPKGTATRRAFFVLNNKIQYFWYMSTLSYPLNNAQIELMKLFGTNLSDSELQELKKLLSRFFADKAIKAADKSWDEKGLTDADMDNWLNEQ